MSSTIAPLLDGFSDRSIAAKDELRTYAVCDPVGFRNEALPVLKNGVDDAARRYLVHLLVKHAGLAEFVADASHCSTDEAVIIARAAQSLGVPLETPLEGLLNATVRDPDAGHTIIRIIDVFAALGIAKLVLRLQKELVGHADQRVRSRAVAELVRAGKGPALVAQVLLQGDPRVQANAVEALWGMTDQNVKPVLLLASKSPHNRVAANGLLGLYHLGMLDSIPQLLRMAQHNDPAQRTSAIWAIGETLDSRFLPFLNREFVKAEGRVKLNIVRSLARIRRQLRTAGDNLRLTLRKTQTQEDGAQRLVLALSAIGDTSAAKLPALSPMHFAIWSGGELVTDYSTRCVSSPPLLIIGFAFPRFVSKCQPYAEVVTKALSACAALKRGSDPWCMERYLNDEASRKAVKEQPALDTTDRASSLAAHMKKNRGFLSDAAFVREVIENTGPRERAAMDVVAVINKLVDTTSRLSGPRHLFVFFDPADSDTSGLERLAKAVKEEPITMHGFVPAGGGGDLTEFRELCEATNGGALHAVPLEDMERAVTDVYLGLLDSYEIVYRPPVNDAALNQSCDIRVSTPVGSGLLTIS